MNRDFDDVRKSSMKLHDEEVERFRALLEYRILDTGSDESFDELGRLAAYVCKTPIAIITFVDENREWFKSVVGLETVIKEVPRDRSFGTYVINSPEEFLAISNPLSDDRTRSNNFLTEYRDINFIAGIPLVDSAGHKLGSLCVLGFQPRELSFEQVSILKTVARKIILQLEHMRDRHMRDEDVPGLRIAADLIRHENGIAADAGPDNMPPASEQESEPAGDFGFGETEESAAKIRTEIRSRISNLENQNKKLLLLCEMDELLQASHNEDEVHTIISNYSKTIFPDHSGALYVFNDILTLLECVSVWGGDNKSEREFQPDKCWGLRLGRVHMADNLKSELYCQHLRDSTQMNYFCAPLLARGKTLGLIYLENRQEAPVYPDDDGSLSSYNQHLAATMAKLSALALANIKHHETLKNFAIYDSLTGLFNRRYMEETLKREISRVTRNKEPLGIIMVDIDHFKQFNDTYGHTAGDMLLKSIGEFFRERIRREDIACRYGGEEFVLILPGSSLENTFRRAEQIHEEIKRVRVRHRGSFISSVEVSMGVVVFSEHGNSAELLLESADRALYKAKTQGRNRIVVA